MSTTSSPSITNEPHEIMFIWGNFLYLQQKNREFLEILKFKFNFFWLEFVENLIKNGE